MELKIKDVADLLSVSETTIRRWLALGKIPAYRLHHQYRFKKSEIEEWLIKCKLRSGKFSLFSKKSIGNRVIGSGGMLFKAINRGGVVADVDGNNKENIIKSTVEKVGIVLGLDIEVVTELLIDRERMMSTAIGEGIAVPHTRDLLLQNTGDVVVACFPKNFVDWGSLDKHAIHTLFFLFARDDKSHLHLLAKLAHLSSNKDMVSLLKSRPSKELLLEAVNKWERVIETGG